MRQLMTATQYPIVTICGSMRYYKHMLELAASLTAAGNIVLMPFVTKGEDGTDIRMLDDMHKTKINMSETIYVVGAHRGESTASEIQYAYEHGVKVIDFSIT